MPSDRAVTTMVLQAVTPSTTAGLGIFWVGRWLQDPGLVGLLLAGCYAVAVAASGVYAVRDARRAERFLGAQPEPADRNR